MLSARHIVPELMDDPSLPAAEHTAALRGLARLNRVSMAHQSLSRRALRATHDLREVTLLDVAAGSGDVSLAVARHLAAAGKRVIVGGVDVSSHATEVAQERFRHAGVVSRFDVANALHDALPEADVVMCTLFLHHLDNADVVALLARLADVTKRVLLVNDLRRCRPGLVASIVVPRLATRSRVVHVDAVRSYRAALSKGELAKLATDAGLTTPRVQRAFPFRMTLEWRPNAAAGAA